MKLISVVTPCYDEEGNVRELYEAVKGVFESLPQYAYEHIFIDNASRDNTVRVLKGIAREDKRLKIIVNNRNFGHIRSPFYGLLQAGGDAAILMAADFQDPPLLIKDFLQKWEDGYKVVLGVKAKADEPAPLYAIRSLYYDLMSELADIELTKNATGFGLYDKVIVEALQKVDDPYPFFRGIIPDLGYQAARVSFTQPKRQWGMTKNSFYTLYDLAMLGIINYSKVPLHIATMAGFLMSGLSLVVACVYLAWKVLVWDWFTVGIAPILITLFFFSSVQLFFIGMIGEYVGAIHTQVRKRPLVVERERVNF